MKHNCDKLLHFTFNFLALTPQLHHKNLILPTPPFSLSPDQLPSSKTLTTFICKCGATIDTLGHLSADEKNIEHIKNARISYENNNKFSHFTTKG